MANQRSVEDIRSGRQEFIWKGPLYEKITVPVWYYIALVVIGVGLGAIFFWLDQPLSAIVVASALLFFLTHANEIPKTLRYSISVKGIQIEDSMYIYNGLKSFWISEKPRLCTLYVEQSGRLSFPLSISIRQSDVSGIRTFLRQHIPESKRQGELFMDVMARLTGLL